MTLNRYKVASVSPNGADKVHIEVITQYDSAERMSPATVTLTVHGEQVAERRIERSVLSDPGLSCLSMLWL